MGRSGSRLGDARQIGLDEAACLVLHQPVRQLVLNRVDERDIPERVRRLLSETGNAFIPLPSGLACVAVTAGGALCAVPSSA